MISPVKVFCSHRAVDRPRVKEFAARLLARGIDAWYDEWNLEPGDNLLTKLNEGLDERDAALVFFSKNQWLDDRVATVMHNRMEHGTRVIPVILDDEAVLPAPLRTVATRTIEQFDEIVAAITGGECRAQL